MAGRGWSWVVTAKLWLIVAGHGRWRQNYGWSLVVVLGGGKIMAGRGWSWMIAQFSNGPFKHVIYFKI